MSAVPSAPPGYALQGLIGHGSLASVYKGTQISIGRPVAIKVIRRERLDRQPMAAPRFRREAQLQGHLIHPNVVVLFDFLESVEGLFMVQEYVTGLTLSDYIRRVSGPIPAADALPMFRQLLAGVGAAHKKLNVVHRDLKPSNILVSQRKKQIKVTDFGIATAVNNTRGIVQRRQGDSLRYRAPEQLGPGGVDSRADIYALGVIFFEMLTGQRLWAQGIPSRSAKTLTDTICRRRPPDPRQLYPHIPERFAMATLKALLKSPSARFATCADFARALDEDNTSRAWWPTSAELEAPASGPTAEFRTFEQTVVHCPRCGQPARVPSDLPHIRVHCPNPQCGHRYNYRPGSL